MSSRDGKRFIETPDFPVDAVNEASAKEKQGGGRPDYWEMVFWWTRKPLAGARAVIAGALLPADTNPAEFKYNLRLAESIAHRKNPHIPARWKEIFGRARLLDPFAGFGSIPLEAVRLGVREVVAVELLPTAYVFLKAVLEYPKWAVERGLGQKLVKDVERWGKWIIERLREDPDIRELYDEDVAVYIGTWEVRCPHCGRWTPLVGNWWLARVSKETSEEEEGEEGTRSGTFKRLAWMEPVKVGEKILIKIIDLNKELNKRIIQAKINSKKGTVIVNGKTYYIPKKNIDNQRNTAICLHCNNFIKKAKRNEWYVKQALKDWNEKLEMYLSGQLSSKEIKEKVLARPRLLVRVKIKDNDVEFEPTTEEDNEKLWIALEKLRQLWGDPDIPTEEMTPYGGVTLGDIPLIFKKWFKLFNPRQLLTLLKLVKLIREASKKIEEEKLSEGRSQEKAFKYAEAIITYLAIALVRYADYNCISTMVDSANPWGIKIAHALSTRGIAMQWNWGDTNPILSSIRISGIFQDTSTLYRALENIINSLSYLVSAVSGSPSRVRVLLDDATVLSKLDKEKFDVIVTDPPYRGDVPYAELSDFYYVWLKRALSDVIDVSGLAIRQPRFLAEAFFENGAEIETQWKYFADKEVSEKRERAEFFGRGIGDFYYFKKLLTKSFQSMSRLLSDNGVLATYYAHTSPDAWEALLEAGWSTAGFRITTTHAVVTESKHRVTARGKASLDVSIVAIWRKGVSGQVLAGEAYSEALGKCTRYASTLLRKGFEGVNLFVGVLGCVLSVFTRYEKVVGVKSTKELVEEYVYPATAEAIARALGGSELAGRLGGTSLFYLLSKVLIARRPRQVRRTLDRSTMVILSIGTRNEVRRLKDFGLVEQEGDKFRLLEPAWGQSDLARAVRSALEKRGVNPRNPVARTAVDLLHLLEYYAVTLPRSEFTRRVEELRGRYPALYEEALGLARLLAEVLSSNDPERELVKRVVGVLAPSQAGLDRWLRGGR